MGRRRANVWVRLRCCKEPTGREIVKGFDTLPEANEFLIKHYKEAHGKKRKKL